MVCVDASGALPITVWRLPGGGVLTSTVNPALDEVELQDGMLVLLNPMQLLMDGGDSYDVACAVSTQTIYGDIQLFSSSKCKSFLYTQCDRYFHMHSLHPT